MPPTQSTSTDALQDHLHITLSNSTESADADAETPELDEDDVFHLLQNERRRRVLAYLREHDDGEGVDMREVVDAIAAEEHDTTVQALRSKERQRVYIALYQSHLPKLDDAGVIEYDQRRGWVSRTAATPNVDRYLTEDEPDTETEDGLPSETAVTGIAAVVLLAGYSGYVPLLTDAIVSIALFGLLCTVALRHRRD